MNMFAIIKILYLSKHRVFKICIIARPSYNIIKTALSCYVYVSCSETRYCLLFYIVAKNTSGNLIISEVWKNSIGNYIVFSRN